MVKQAKLAEIVAQREHVAAMKRECALAEAELAHAEDEVVRALDAGEGMEWGAFAAGIHEQAVRRPKWKVVYEALTGPAGVAEVVAATVPTIQRGLTIVDVARRRDVP
jgi:hypothetical protein